MGAARGALSAGNSLLPVYCRQLVATLAVQPPENRSVATRYDPQRCNLPQLVERLTVTGTRLPAQNWHVYCLRNGESVQSAPAGKSKPTIVPEEGTMWTKPDFTEMRFGFEITMYIGNR